MTATDRKQITQRLERWATRYYREACREERKVAPDRKLSHGASWFWRGYRRGVVDAAAIVLAWSGRARK